MLTVEVLGNNKLVIPIHMTKLNDVHFTMICDMMRLMYVF